MKKELKYIVLLCLLVLALLNSCVKDPNLPILSTKSGIDIKIDAVTSGGIIIKDGGAEIVARGICWGTSPNPTIDGAHTTDDKGTGSFTTLLSSLTPNTLYYVRAYATNSVGTAYGNEISFTTNPILVASLTTNAISSITLSSAVSGGIIASDRGGAITSRGVCWATTSNPTVADDKTTNGTGSGTFTSSISGLLPGTTYNVRSYAVNSAGTSYGNVVSFTTNPIVVATLVTEVITSITSATAVSGGNITADGGGVITARGICWSTSPRPTTTNFKTVNGNGTGSYTSNLINLLPGTTYFVRAYATNEAGPSYGNELTFTASVIAPTLTTTQPTNIAVVSATSGGTITSNGGGSIIVSGICWATTTNPTTGDSKTTDGTGTGSYASNLSSLNAGSTYYVRAYATNSAATSYGIQFSFNTKIADVDGNTYNTIKIGNQVWMAEDLKTTLFNSGSAIPVETDNTTWTNLTTPAYCWYDNNITYKNTYGALYNWYAASSGNLCPTGWHVPTDVEFNTLEINLGMPPAQANVWGWRLTTIGDKMKNTTGWASGQNGSNTSGFSALPGGYRHGPSGLFSAIGQSTYWWSSTADVPEPSTGFERGWYRFIEGSNTDIYKASTTKAGGKFVRCLKN